MSNEDIKAVSKKKPEVNDSSKELISNSESRIDIYSTGSCLVLTTPRGYT